MTITQQHVDALTWASWGFRIFPLRPANKLPRIKGWQQAATSDTAQIDRWWTRWPDSNIGCVPFAGHIVVYIDARSGGFQTWKKISHGRAIPRTLTNQTGGGGLHIWFRLPEDKPVRGKIPGGIDLQSERRLVAMPGSIHTRTGNLYKVRTWAPVAMLPKWLEEHVYQPPVVRRPYTPPTGRRSSADGLIRHMAAQAKGDRNNTLYSCAMAVIEEGHPEHVLDQLVDAARAAGLPDSRIFPTINSARERVMREAA